MKPRKPRHNLDLVRQANEELIAARTRLDRAILDSLALDTPWRALAEVLNVSHTSLRNRYLTPGAKRHRWPNRPGIQAAES